MIKSIIRVLVFTMLLGLTGCGSGRRDGRDVLKKFEDAGYTIYFRDYDNRCYYDNKGNIYPYEYDKTIFPGKKDNTLRLPFKPKEIGIEIRKNDTESFALSNISKEDSSLKKEENLISYTDGKSNKYVKDLGDLKEEKVIFDIKYYKTEPHIYFFEEHNKSKEGYDEEDICGEESKKDATKVKNRYEKELDALGISEEDLLTLSKWIDENTKKEILKTTIKTFNGQEKLTIDEIVDKFEDANFYLDTLDDGNRFVSFEDRILDKVYCLVGNKDNIITYEFIDGQDIKEGIYWVIETDREILTVYGRESIYDVEKEKHETTKKLTEDQISEGEYLRYMVYDDILKSLRITKDDLFTFFIEYKK